MLDMRSRWSSIREAAKHGPLQSLTDRELNLRENPLTIYPHGSQHRVQAWGRFGPESIRVDAKIVRSTPLEAGIEFRRDNETYRCWAWGNAVTINDVSN